MTFQELIDRVPSDKRHLPVEWNVDVGTFPSGEEGAEDWIMGAYFEGIEIRTRSAWRDEPEQEFIEISVGYS